MYWDKYPLIKFVPLFIVGIILQYYLIFSTILLLLVLGGLIISAFIFSKIYKRRSARFLTVSLLVITCGAAYTVIHSIDEDQYPFEEKYIDFILIRGEVLNIDLPQDKKLTIELKAEKFYKDNTGYEFTSVILCNLYYDNNVIIKILDKLKPGNTLVIAGSLNEPPGSRNPGDFNYKEYLAVKGISTQFSSSNPGDFVIINDDEKLFDSFIFETRLAVDKALHKIYNSQTAGLLRGLFLADRSKIDHTVRENFVNSGVVHVLAVSGLHVGFIILIYFFIFGRFSVLLKYTFTILGLVFYIFITGAPASVVRASIMASVILISLMTSRTHNNFNALALAALIILLINPYALFTPGFQLSFSAVLSIFIIYPPLQTYINGKTKNAFAKYVLLFFAVSLAAQIGTIPFTIYYFEKLSVVSLIANLFVIPLVGFIVGIGILTLFLYPLSYWLVSVFAAANMLIAKIMFWIVKSIGSLEFSHLYIPDFSLYDGVIIYSALILILLFHYKLKSRSAIAVFYLLLFTSSFVFLKLDDEEFLSPGKLSIVNFDLGNSESILLKFPDNSAALINCGGKSVNFDQGEQIIIPFLKRNGIDSLTYILLTHISPKTTLGLISLIENGFVKKIYKPRVYGNDLFNNYFEKYLNECGVDVNDYPENKIKIGGAALYPLPFRPEKGFSTFNIFNNSTPIKIVYGKTSFLVTGGLETRGERFLIERYKSFLSADLLKIANNGSNIGTSMEFIESVRPSYSVIDAQIGNWLGYPSQQVLERLSSMGSSVLRTDEQNAILFESDGQKIEIIDWKNH